MESISIASGLECFAALIWWLACLFRASEARRSHSDRFPLEVWSLLFNSFSIVLFQSYFYRFFDPWLSGRCLFSDGNSVFDSFFASDLVWKCPFSFRCSSLTMYLFSRFWFDDLVEFLLISFFFYPFAEPVAFLIKKWLFLV